MKEKIKKMPGRIRNYFCSHMSDAGYSNSSITSDSGRLVLQIYVKNQYFNYLLRNTRSMEESMIETSTINIDANLKDIISAACNVGVNETLRVLVENTEADGILLAKEKLTLGSRMDDIAHQIGSVVSIAIVSDEGLWQEYGVYWYQTSSKGVWEDGNLDKLQEIYEKTMALQKEKANVRYYVEDRSCCSQSVAADKNGTYCSSADWKNLQLFSCEKCSGRIFRYGRYSGKKCF